jgi:metal-responsive CopG/Arc/MetJ family transcriptional regulator
MAKVMVSIPDELLEHIDAEAGRRGISRSSFLQQAAHQVIGLGPPNREEIIAGLEELSEHWTGPTDVVAQIRRDRQRNG